LRPFLQLARLPDRALAAARQALEDDEDFRARVAEVATPENVGGEAGILFLTRPDGWEETLAALETAAREEQSAGLEEAEERTARRRLRGAEEAARRAESALTAARADLARVTEELAAERKARAEVETQLAAMTEAEAKVRAEAGSSRAAADRARRERAELEARLTETEEAMRTMAAAAAESAESAELAAAAAADAADAADAEAVESQLPPSPPPPHSPSTETETEAPAVSMDAVGRAVAEAAAAAEQLGRALAAAAAALDPSAAAAAAVEPVPVPPTEAAVVLHARHPKVRPSGPKRTPSALPPAVFDDSVEAAEHLVRINGVILLVDGYNVSKLRWPELPIADQRRRLADALGGLAARTGADVHAVFDGAEQADPTPPSGPRRLVRIVFSPPDVEADDVIIGLVDTLPLHRPVVVASNDRRVQDGASHRGANVISADQLLAVLTR